MRLGHLLRGHNQAEFARPVAAQPPAQAAPSAPPVAPIGHASQYEAALHAALSAMTTMEARSKERTDYKRNHALPALMPYVAAYMQRGDTAPSEIAVQAMVWLFDTAQIEKAIALGLYLAKTKNQAMPKRFVCTLETFVVEQVYLWADEQLKKDASAEPYLGRTVRAMEEGAWKLHPIKTGMLYAMAAKHAYRLEEWQEALDWIAKAEAANPGKTGTKGLKERADLRLKEAKQAA